MFWKIMFCLRKAWAWEVERIGLSSPKRPTFFSSFFVNNKLTYFPVRLIDSTTGIYAVQPTDIREYPTFTFQVLQ